MHLSLCLCASWIFRHNSLPSLLSIIAFHHSLFNVNTQLNYKPNQSNHYGPCCLCRTKGETRKVHVTARLRPHILKAGSVNISIPFFAIQTALQFWWCAKGMCNKLKQCRTCFSIECNWLESRKTLKLWQGIRIKHRHGECLPVAQCKSHRNGCHEWQQSSLPFLSLASTSYCTLVCWGQYPKTRSFPVKLKSIWCIWCHACNPWSRSEIRSHIRSVFFQLDAGILII